MYYEIYSLRGGFVSASKNVENLHAFSDDALTDLIKEGQESAFEEITGRYKNLITLLAKQYCAPGFDLCDFTQEGLLGLLSACRTFDAAAGASFKNYAALCIKRRYISIIRKSQAKGTIPKDSLISIDEIELSDKNLNNPENLMVSRERLEDVLKQMKSTLSPTEIRVFYLYLKGLSYDEISKTLRFPKKSVDNALQRVKKKLQS